MSERTPAQLPSTAAQSGVHADSGCVYLVGAGPGSADLLTVRARRKLQEADVVLHDSLAGDEVVESLPEDTEVVDVGKRSDERTSQTEINQVMVERSRQGDVVVRLKGGDPCIFGRGGEEAEHLSDADVEHEIVPGVSSVSAAPAAAGVPLTHRAHSSSFTVVTGHEDPGKDESALDWRALADSVDAGGTLVVLMGVGRLEENVHALLDNDVDPSTEAALVESATLESEALVTGTLDNIVERARAAELSPPAVTVVGGVAAFAGR